MEVLFMVRGRRSSFGRRGDGRHFSGPGLQSYAVADGGRDPPVRLSGVFDPKFAKR
ncbi:MULTISPECIES: hypothetical protein [unclassified Arthrobacter]|uniref:hypothetical protein n=1 Tax=unclassified Arthrobacter TaxID=235627 RepID=UPI001E6511BF|nr:MULTISPECIES: hypothetical protein [unclassified Arthrobacter]MCC9145264.1 hypothetical protein [Arthrobacter sp. zg-Y919]MDK1276492.1 hypothetical protein [Arthrobacter sp. zg.Y919]WIB01912.1 hypothetical protein QNO10_07885 [Arthrobacter sp. zg-Y919]